MAELTIELRRDARTGKHDILIHLESDADALPHEHEQHHRELVERIVGKGNVGKVIVRREAEKAPPAAASEEASVRTAQEQAG